MNKLKTTDNGGMPLELDDIRWEQDAVREAFYGLISAWGIAPADSFVLSGCVVTLGSPDTWTAGYLCMGGEVFKVDAGSHSFSYSAGYVLAWVVVETYDSTGTEQFEDSSSHDTYLIRRATVGQVLASTNPMLINGPTLLNKIMGTPINWVTPTLITSPQVYANNGGTDEANAGYYKDNMGMVHLQGVVKQTSHSLTGASAFQLPAGMRPLTNKFFSVLKKDTNTFIEGWVDKNGFVNFSFGTITADAVMDMSPICFLAEQ